MKTLARRIATDLKKSKVTAVYNSELSRVFPKSMSFEERQDRIRRFAAEHGLNVEIFEVGLCAVFERMTAKKSGKNKARR